MRASSADGADRLLIPRESETGSFIRETDWSTTPLGPTSKWPPALINAYNLLLNSALPAFICWGPHWSTLFNDLLLPFLGERETDLLAKPLSEVWPAAWSALQQELTAVSTNGLAITSPEVSFRLQRQMPEEEVYLQFSCSPLREDEDRIGGVLVSCLEISEKVLARRRLAAEQRLASTLRQTKRQKAIYRAACETLAGNADIPFALFYLHEKERARLRLAGGAGLHPQTASAPALVDLENQADPPWPLQEVLRSGDTTVVEEPHRSPSLRRNTAYVLPLAVAGEEPFGVAVMGLSPYLVFDEAYQAFLEAMRDQTANALARARFLRDREEQEEEVKGKSAHPEKEPVACRRKLDLLLGVSLEVVAEKHVDGLLQRVVDAACELTQTRRGSSWHLDEEGRLMVGAVCPAEEHPEQPQTFVPDKGGIYLELLTEHESLRFSDEEMRSHPNWWGLPEGHLPLRGLLGARLLDSRGRPNGLIMVTDKEGGLDFSEEDLSLLKQLAAITSLAMQHIEARLESEKRAREAEDGRVQVRKSEERLQAIVNRAPVVFFVKDLDGAFLMVNEYFQELFQVRQEELLGKTDYDFLSREFADQFCAHDDQVLESGEPLEFEEQVHLEDGLHTFQTIKFPLQGADGEIYALCGIATDITARERSERRLQQVADELARSNQDLEQFAHAVSHDLREPLRTITRFLELIQRRYADRLDSEVNDLFRFVVEGAARMGEMVRDLLEYSRVQRGEEAPAPVDLFEVYLDAVDNLQASIEETGAHISHDPLPVVTGEKSQLIRLFQNLLANAIKFRSGRPPEIHLGVGLQNGQWVFSVRDNGIGMDQPSAERIFQVFQRLHTQDEYPGTGIGLAICKKILERHDGRIWVESQLGEGSTFFFTLARQQAPGKTRPD